jgi:hypothetical protein
MADSSMWATPSSADEARHRAVSPHEGRDYTLIPEYPTRDFGEGDVTFDPAYAQKALEKLNELLYLAVDRRGADVVPPICGGTPGATGFVLRPRPAAGGHAGLLPRSRWRRLSRVS